MVAVVEVAVAMAGVVAVEMVAAVVSRGKRKFSNRQNNFYSDVPNNLGALISWGSTFLAKKFDRSRR